MLHFKPAIRGFSLFEMLITVVIVGILTAVVLPSFQDSIQASRRGVAKSHLLRLAQMQAKWRVSNVRYTSDLTALGIPVANFNKISDTDLVYANELVTSKYYWFSLESENLNNSFKIIANPYSNQSQVNDKCNILQIDQDANITSTSNSNDCS